MMSRYFCSCNVCLYSVGALYEHRNVHTWYQTDTVTLAEGCIHTLLVKAKYLM